MVFAANNMLHHKRFLSPICSQACLSSISTTFLVQKSFQRVFNNPFSLDTQSTQRDLANELESILHKTGSNLLQVSQVHTQLIVNGFINDNALLAAKVLGTYVVSDSFTDARKLFLQHRFHCARAWNWMIRGFVKFSCFDFALLFYFKMLGSGVCPDKYTFPVVIKACVGLNNVRLGKMIHETILKMGFDVDEFSGSSLIKLYAENGCVEEACHLFEKMPNRDCVLWNVMINGFAKCEDFDNAIRLFKCMRGSEIKPNAITCACVISVCASEGMIEYGVQLHGSVFRSGLVFQPLVSNTLVSMYSKWGYLSDAHKLFRSMPEADLVAWNRIIGGHVQNGLMEEASTLFREMISSGVKPDSITFACFLPSVTESMSLSRGKEIHGYTVRHGVTFDAFLKSALIDLYSKCSNVEMARKIFNQNTTIDVAICTAMISGYVSNGMNMDALEVFRLLLRGNGSSNELTMASVLPACTGLAAIKLGKELHGNVIKNGLDRRCHVGSAVMDMYGKCGRLDLTQEVFRRITEKDAVCWNSMITTCAQNGEPDEAIDLFGQMGKEGMQYTDVSISAALSACANIPALHYGKEIHGFMIKGEFNSNLFAESALIDMYAKCGSLDFARRVFDTMQQKNEVAWNSIIAAYGNHGRFEQCLSLFDRMLENAIRPDGVTFLAIISACCHTGRVVDGVRFFECMTEEYGIPPSMEHYSCMVDLFGRAGRINEAFRILKSMPFPPDAGAWGTLLAACRVHGNLELAEEASKRLLELDPKNSGFYVLLSNTQADAGKWRSVIKTRGLMKERGVHKVPGYSWITVNSSTHTFCAADVTHSRSVDIYSLLEILLQDLRREGYVHSSSSPSTEPDPTLRFQNLFQDLMI